MQRRQIICLLAATLLGAPGAWAAPCATACKDEIAACVSAECQGLRARARQRCKRIECRKPIVTDCYGDLAVCGATSARPPGSGKSPPAGGW
jgi:hypothetical protein